MIKTLRGAACFILIATMVLWGTWLKSDPVEQKTVANAQTPGKPKVGLTNNEDNQWKGVKQVFQKGSVQNGVFKVSFPRTDLRVKVDAVQIDPNLALNTYLVFTPHGNGAMMMGDLVLLEKEVKPVEAKLVELGIGVTALHNHIIEEDPKIMYLHVAGVGDPKILAEKMKQVLAQTGTPLTPEPPSKAIGHANWSRIEEIIGHKGQLKGNVFQFSIPRPEEITETNETGRPIVITPAMGVAMPINFQLIDDGNAVTTGDLVLLANEVNPVIRKLVTNGITVTALHNHMLNESPRLFFLHFWGKDNAEKLARGLRDALNQTSLAK